jgi:uncharacterized protein
MTPSGNAATVAGIYAAYERGDIESVLACLAEEVTFDDWRANSAQLAGVPWMARRDGKQAVRNFFAEAEGMEVRRMRIGPPMSSGNVVAVEVEFAAANPDLEDSECHVWTFDESGRVIAMRHYLDTAKHIAAAGRPWPYPTATASAATNRKRETK